MSKVCEVDIQTKEPAMSNDPQRNTMKVLEELRVERKKQLSMGYTPEHDDAHTHKQMCHAAIAYAMPEEREGRLYWPWPNDIQRRDRREDLVKAASILVAEIERMDRHRADKKSLSDPNLYEFKYLHRVSENAIVLDHRLTPELRACLSAMSSRMPRGGVAARYLEILFDVIQDENADLFHMATHRDAMQDVISRCEVRLTEHPLPKRVKAFFDTHVRKYGHSSPIELTGSPTVFFEGVSMATCYALFDGPLVAGQEFSTRALRRKDWPMCAEISTAVKKNDNDTILEKLRDLHCRWLSVHEKELEYWKEHYSKKANREAEGITDDEPFRPALDKCRWALPGTIATGVSQTGNLRGMARIINDARSLLENGAATEEGMRNVWEQIKNAYEFALPGMKGLGLKEAVADEKASAPVHLELPISIRNTSENHTRATVLYSEGGIHLKKLGQYLDPVANHVCRIRADIFCSYGVARDWHRHRTFYPWRMNIVVDGSSLLLHPAYAPETEQSRVHGLLKYAYSVYTEMQALEMPLHMILLALPFGAQVRMQGTAGLRDAVYTFELRAHAKGANFEYKSQAETMLEDLQDAGVLGYLPETSKA